MEGSSRKTCASSAGRSLQAQPEPWLSSVSRGALGWLSDSAVTGLRVESSTKMRLLKVLPAALLCGACSTTPAITVVATPATVAGDGLSVITVTAKPTEGGSPIDAVVHFTLQVL